MDLPTVDELLTTTRSVRRRLDINKAVSNDVVVECLRLAIQAPNAGNAQNWAWVVITDAAKKAELSRIYRTGVEAAYRAQAETLVGPPKRIIDSALDLIDHLQDVPVHVLPCVLKRTVRGQESPASALFGSIYPAVWSFQLALRSRGLGSTMLYVSDEAAVSDLLGLPEEAILAGLLPVGYYTGDGFRPAKRRPVEEVIHWNGWHGTELTAHAD